MWLLFATPPNVSKVHTHKAQSPFIFHFWASPDPEWSGTQSSPLSPASPDGWWTGWKCWPKLPACTGADTAACCDASPSGRCPGTSAGQSPPPVSAQQGSRQPWQSLCSHRQTWTQKEFMFDGRPGANKELLTRSTIGMVGGLWQMEIIAALVITIKIPV